MLPWCRVITFIPDLIYTMNREIKQMRSISDTGRVRFSLGLGVFSCRLCQAKICIWGLFHSFTAMPFCYPFSVELFVSIQMSHDLHIPHIFYWSHIDMSLKDHFSNPNDISIGRGLSIFSLFELYCFVSISRWGTITWNAWVFILSSLFPSRRG
jgi:hypothetical protein